MLVQEKKVKFLEEFKELFNPEWRYIVYYGGRASGKSLQVALALLIRGRQTPLRILCTREIQKTIRDSVHKLLSDLIAKYEMGDYQILNDSIRNIVTGTEFIFKGLRLNVNEIKSTEGIDVCWVEEAQSASADSLNVLTPTIRKPGSQIIFTFNRFTELDPVFVRFVQNQPAKTYVKKVNFDVLERAGLLPDVIRLEIEEDRATPSLFAHKWLGEPVSQDEFSALSRDLVMGAMSRDIEGVGSIEVGVDVARMGNDRIVFWMLHGLKTLKFEVHQKKRIPETCDLLEFFVNYEKSVLLKIDDTGVGGGVTDEMSRRGYQVAPINFGGEPAEKDKYPNLISEAWFNMAQIITQIQLPSNQDLLMELTTRRWHHDNKGRRCIESKEDYKKRGYRSPDLADACIIAFYRSIKKTVTFEFV